MGRICRMLLVFCCCLAGVAAAGAPLPKEAAPEPLKSWIPWVLHGEETRDCPPAWNDANLRQCVWPGSLEITASAKGASFSLTVDTFGKENAVPLPGDGEFWPQAAQANGKALPVVEKDGGPAVVLPAGKHVISGVFFWHEMPGSLQAPRQIAVVRVKTAAGWSERQPGEGGEVWLRGESAEEGDGEALSLRVFRRVEDGQPLRVTSRFELTFAGKAREVTLEQALLPDFTAVSLNSPLPARLGPDGAIRLQARPGVHVIKVVGRRMDRVMALALPEAANREEIWSWQPDRSLRVVNVNGVTVDPKQTGVPGEWQNLSAYLLNPGAALELTEVRRGDPQPEADKLTLRRTLWLDDDGQGYTVFDRIGGAIRRAWRLEAGPPLSLGHASVDGVDQYITRLDPAGPAGMEIRHGQADVVADSRIEAGLRQFPLAGWNTSFQTVQARLNLPPGWRLLHASGVDQADGSWLGAWTLWDFFFLLLTALAAWKTCGVPAGALLGAALALSWHVPGAPVWLWLPALAALAAARALGEGRLANFLRWTQGILAAVILLLCLDFGVDQVRMAIYPALEKEYRASRDWSLLPTYKLGAVVDGDDAAIPAAAPAADAGGDGETKERSPAMRAAAKPVPAETQAMQQSQRNRYAQDAGVNVQTGPGLPQWRWHSHDLSIQGPVSGEQQVDLWLLPPAAHALLRVAAVLLLLAAFWRIFLPGRRLGWPPGKPLPALARTTPLAVFLALTLSLGLSPQEARAADAADPALAAPQPGGENWQKWLDALRQKLLPEPDCLPACAQFPRLALEAGGKALWLRLEAHAATAVAVPLPGQAAQFPLRSVSLDGRPATVFRDDEGQVWLHLPPGVHQVVMEADVAQSVAVNITLPLAPRHLEAKLTGWTLAGADERGVPQGALTLTRVVSGSKAGSETTRDALPPLVEVERTVNLTDRWTIDTVIRRAAPSLAPMQVTVPLLPGERVTDAAVRVAEGRAIVALGANDEARFSSALDEVPQLTLKASPNINQVERWRLNADTRWHVAAAGLAPTSHQEADFWLPQWQPWPGDELRLDIRRPAGVPGPGLTLDSLKLSSSPGARLTEVRAELVLRSSLGSSHGVELPEGAELVSVSIDGAPQPLRAEGRKLSLPVHPGRQKISLLWREAKGIETFQPAAAFSAGIAGVNGTTEIHLGDDRWVLAAGGPRLGPAVLIWGTLAVVLLAALALARSGWTPLGAAGWTLLGLGLAQAGVIYAFLVAGWFLLLAARGRYGPGWPRWLFNLGQVFLVLATLVALQALFYALHTGLLGTPDMLITGNGSHDRQLIWYQDRLTGAAPAAWVFSLPLWVYRVLMLAWALWLAAGVIRWARWAWRQASQGGLWRPGPPKAPKTPQPPQPSPQPPQPSPQPPQTPRP